MIWKLFWRFFKIGMFSIGGGYAIIPLIQEEVVENQGWLTEKVFTDIITISQMTPGPIAVNTSTFVGMQIAGLLGAVAATIGAVTAGVGVSLSLYSFFQHHQESVVISSVLQGLKAASVGLIASAAFTILLLTFFGTSDFGGIANGAAFNFKALLIFVGSFFLLKKYRLNPILLMVIAGVAGLLLY